MFLLAMELETSNLNGLSAYLFSISHLACSRFRNIFCSGISWRQIYFNALDSSYIRFDKMHASLFLYGSLSTSPFGTVVI